MSSRFHVGTLTKAKLKSPQVVLPVKQKKLATFQERDTIPSTGNKVSYIDAIDGQESIKELLQIKKDAFKNSGSNVGHLLFTGPSGCISGDAFVKFSVKDFSGKIQNNKGGTLETLYNRFNRIKIDGKGGWIRPQTTNSIYSIQSMDDQGRVFQNKIIDVIDSGIKPVYKITTQFGLNIKATEDHEFITPNGDIPLRNLDIGDDLYISRNLKSNKGRTINPKLPTTTVKFHPRRKKRCINGNWYHSCLISWLIIEADKNNMTYLEYKEALNNGRNDLWFIPEGFEVHHKDGNTQNNLLENLELLTLQKHHDIHKDHIKHALSLVEIDKIISIEYIGEEQVYDVKVEDPYRNFIANGVVVHNCGKTKFANAFALDLGVPFYPILGNRITKWSEIVQLLSTIQENDIVFIDEIHALKNMFQNNFYNILQDYTFDDIVKGSAVTYKLPKFSLWGATTHAGFLNEAFKNRFTDVLEMVPYTRNQLTRIIINTAMNEFNVNINNELAYHMSNLVRGTPRYAVNMIKTLVDVSAAYQTGIDMKVLTKSLQLKNLDPYLGLDFTARKYMFALYNNGSMGTASIGIHINEEEKTVIALEKFLFSYFEVPELNIKGPLIVKGLGKKLSPNGQKYIDGIRKLKQSGWFLAENWE